MGYLGHKHQEGQMSQEPTHNELLLKFREYVDNCIQNNTVTNPLRGDVHPMSFDEWYARIYCVSVGKHPAPQRCAEE